MLEADIEVMSSNCYQLMQRLYPICRSITGDGLRQTLRIIQEYVPIEIHEVASGTQVFDWTVPYEWNVTDAYIIAPDGKKIIDFKRHNLHLMSYSVPVNQTMSLQELKPHLHSLPEHPDWIPYRTSYYAENWGFCLSHNQLSSLSNGQYQVVIDTRLEVGHLSYGEIEICGSSEEEILIFSHCCHPSLCNDNLSGVTLSVFLARHLLSLQAQKQLRYSYRFIFTPATIGSITWLSRNESRLHNIKHGLVAAVLGDSGRMTYKKSRAGDAEIDRAVLHVLKHFAESYSVLPFEPYGYDERQFSSPGINLAMGRLTRTPNGCYPEYHTSADNLGLMSTDALADSFDKYLKTLYVLENNRTYINTSPKGEPQLGRRGLYRKTGGHKDIGNRELAYLWVLNQSDGENSLLKIAEKSGIDFITVSRASEDLIKCGLLKLVE